LDRDAAALAASGTCDTAQHMKHVIILSECTSNTCADAGVYL
jgi:hypothetical protein